MYQLMQKFRRFRSMMQSCSPFRYTDMPLPSSPEEVKDVGRVLGEGGWGKVKVGIYQNKRCAIKQMTLQGPNDATLFEHEYCLQQLVHNHPHIVKVYDIVTEAFSCCIFMEYAGSRTLYDLIDSEGLDYKQRLIILGGVSDAVCHMHSLGVAHMDVKAENVIVDDDDITHVRLTDMGFACHVSQHQIFFCGTFGYCAPEIMMSDTRGLSPMHADVWSFGVLTVALFHGCLPFGVADPSKCEPFSRFAAYQQLSNKCFPSACINACYGSPLFNWDVTVQNVVDSCLWLRWKKRSSMQKVRSIITSKLSSNS